MYVDLYMHFCFGELVKHLPVHSWQKEWFGRVMHFLFKMQPFSLYMGPSNIPNTCRNFSQDIVLSHSLIGTQYLAWLIKDWENFHLFYEIKYEIRLF